MHVGMCSYVQHARHAYALPSSIGDSGYVFSSPSTGASESLNRKMDLKCQNGVLIPLNSQLVAVYTFISHVNGGEKAENLPL